jgi:hypothetical protein
LRVGGHGGPDIPSFRITNGVQSATAQVREESGQRRHSSNPVALEKGNLGFDDAHPGGPQFHCDPAYKGL